MPTIPKLKADFVADWIAHLRQYMINTEGRSAVEVAALDDRDVRICYFDAQHRRIAAVPRTLKTADSFSCPPNHQAGWDVLQKKIQEGVDINPYLSKHHASLFNLDGLLAEWGVHHFHLGIASDPKNRAYIARTRPLLYALVTHEVFYAINVYSHESFEDTSVLESIHRNWPALIRRYRAKGITGGTWTPDQRRVLRAKNANVATAVADGTVYLPISGGVMASGVNARAAWLSDYWQIRFQRLQADVEAKLDEVLPVLRKNGYTGDSEIEAKLHLFSEVGVQVFFPKYNVLVNLRIMAPAVSGP